MKHAEFPKFYDDMHGIGQKRLAEIRAEIAMAEMGENVRAAFGLQYQTPEWRAMSRRIFYRARAQHDRALAVINHMEQVQ